MSHPSHASQAATLQAWTSHFADHKSDLAYPLARKALASCPRHQKATQSRLHFLLGMTCWSLGKYSEAAQWFQQNKDIYLTGYSWMLAGDLQKAYQTWQPLLATKPNHWCGALLGLVSQRLQMPPSFLGIRNHTEMDIYALSQASQMTFLENYLHYRNMLGMVNPEVYKLMGRSLSYAGSPQRGLALLLEAQRICAQDPEVYFHLGQVYHRLKQFKEARLMLQQTLMMQPTYVPAQDLLLTLPQA